MPNEALEELALVIETKRADAVLGHQIAFGELTLDIAPAQLHSFTEFLKTDSACRFTTLIDLTATDNPGATQRFTVVYHYLSMYQNHRIRLRVGLREGEMLATICDIHPSANWFEREVFDMFGILFSNHPDMRRILTDYGFRGHPLRKDFPTTGYVEVRYDEVAKRVVYEPVTLVQEYRQYDFLSPWEGAKYILPGDEKTKEGAK